MEVCCGKRVSDGEEKKRRRNLSNPDGKTYVQALISLVAECKKCVDNAVDATQLHTGYICRLCGAKLERYQNLHKLLIANLAGATPILPKRSSISLELTRQSMAKNVCPAAVSLSSSPAVTVSI